MDERAQATSQGRVEREAVEDATDRLAARLLRPVDPQAVDRLLAQLAEPARLLRAVGIPPRQNPIGPPTQG